jgi:hypothetical protein
MPITPSGKTIPDNTRHGHSKRGQKTTEYLTWESMIRRCTNPKQRAYANYGGKGVTVSVAWRTFDNFLQDMGAQPEGFTLERDDPTRGYEQGNCSWIRRSMQARNKSTTRWLTYNGCTQCLVSWAEQIGMKPKTLRARIDDHGWSVERAISTPIGKPKP